MPMRHLLCRLSRNLLLLALCATAAQAMAASEATAQNTCPPMAAMPSQDQLRTAMQTAGNHGFLWRVTRGDHSSYLYGTIHAARLDWMFPGPAVLDALKASDTVALELDAMNTEIQRRLMAGMRAPSAPLPQALDQRLRQRLRSECLPEQDIMAYVPEMRIATLLVMAGRRDGLDPSFGVDVFLAGLARGARKSVVSLETPELQLQAIRQPTLEKTIEFVGDSLDLIDTGAARATLVRLAKAWADSDLATLSQYESWCDCMKTESDRADMARMLDDRNPALADSIAILHASGKRVFAAVGSLHMIGPKGLPALLAGKGFEVTLLLPATRAR